MRGGEMETEELKGGNSGHERREKNDPVVQVLGGDAEGGEGAGED